MSMKNSLETYGFTETEIQDLEMFNFISLAKEKGLTEMEIEGLKNYRRLLKVRSYGKDFRKRERIYLQRLREEKRLWEREVTMLKQEIEWYRDENSVLEVIELLDVMESNEVVEPNPIFSQPYFM